MPVSQGSTRPTAARSSIVAVNRTTGRGNIAMPVWPVASIRSLLMVDFAVPDPAKNTARVIWAIQSAVFITSSSRCCSRLRVSNRLTGRRRSL